MPTPVRSSFTGRELAERGPLVLDAQQCAAHQQLGALGINVAPLVAALDAALTGPASGTVGAPFWELQTWLPGVVRQVTRLRAIDELTGAAAIGQWSDLEIIQEVEELAGQAELYGDTTNIPLANYKAGYERRGVVRFELGFSVTRLDEDRESRTGTNAAERKRAAVVRALDEQRNRVGFLGYNAPDMRIYGFLNDPNLPAYTNFAAGASASILWSSKTFLEITADIRRAVADLVVRAGGNINIRNVDTTMGIPLGHEEYLSVTASDGGVSVAEWIAKTYPRMRTVSAPELTGANGGANGFYLYADRVDDGSTDGGEVFMQMIPARFETLGVEQRAKGRVEDFTNALAGVMVKRPWAVVRYSGL